MSGSPFFTRMARGTLRAFWITEESSRRDVLLHPGQSFRLRTPGLAIVEAWTDAAITFAPEVP